MKKLGLIFTLVVLFILPVLAQDDDQIIPVGSRGGVDAHQCVDQARNMIGATMIGDCLCNVPGGWQLQSIYSYQGNTASQGACTATYSCGGALAKISIDGGIIKAGCAFIP